jgi:carbamoyltransferase
VDDLACVAFYDKPLLKFERILETYLAVAPRGFRSFRKAGPLWAKEKLFTDRDLRRALGALRGRDDAYAGDVLYAEHHESHAASAFYPSPFEEAAVLTIDGVGEWATASIGVGRGASLDLLKEQRWPDSLGLLYSAFTSYTGFRVNSGEYKVMGLAPYGEPTYVDAILDHLLALRDDGSFTLDQRYFAYLAGLTMTSPAFHDLFGGPPRAPESPLTQRHLDLARSVQRVCEEIVLRMARTAHRVTGCRDLCLAGGVALNSVANGRVLREGPFARLWIQPAAGDAGGALGAAQLAWHRALDMPRTVARGGDGQPRDAMHGALSRARRSTTPSRARARASAPPTSASTPTRCPRAWPQLLADGARGRLVRGRMEFGPRALGARSILGDPRDPDDAVAHEPQDQVPRELPPVRAERARRARGEWFELDAPSPYMLLVAPVRRGTRRPEDGAASRARAARPRAPHPGGHARRPSARVQTVDARPTRRSTRCCAPSRRSPAARCW